MLSWEKKIARECIKFILTTFSEVLYKKRTICQFSKMSYNLASKICMFLENQSKKEYPRLTSHSQCWRLQSVVALMFKLIQLQI